MKSKIVLVTLNLEGGGAEKIVSRIILNLYNQFDIVLVTFYPGGRYSDELLSLPGLEYHCINARKGNTLSFALRLREILKKASPDKVISFLYYPNIITYLSLIWLNIPMILSERSNHRLYLTKSLKHRIWKTLLKRAYGKASTVISVSEESKKALISDFTLPSEKLYTIYNGISFSTLDRLKEEPVTEFEFKNEIRYFVAVGSLNKAKNYPLLIESFRILHSIHNNTSLIIIGKGALEGEIKEIINRSGLSQEIHLTGYCLNPYKFLRHASCYVLSSNWEGFPNALLEAMYINGHVVSTDCPTGPAEIIFHNHDGLLCKMNDPEELAQAMERMCFDEDFRTKVYENSRKKIVKFDEQIMIDKYRNIFQKSDKE